MGTLEVKDTLQMEEVVLKECRVFESHTFPSCSYMSNSAEKPMHLQPKRNHFGQEHFQKEEGGHQRHAGKLACSKPESGMQMAPVRGQVHSQPEGKEKTNSERQTARVRGATGIPLLSRSHLHCKCFIYTHAVNPLFYKMKFVSDI